MLSKNKIIVCVGIFLLLSSILYGCSKNDINLSLKEFIHKEKNQYELVVSNSTTILDLNEYVVANENIIWTLTASIEGTNKIPSNVASLKIGDNTYYILAEFKNTKKIYTLQIKRKSLYSISFNTFGGTNIERQFVEDGDYATIPEDPIKTGFTFQNWDFDFKNKITSHTTINAIWQENARKQCI